MPECWICLQDAPELRQCACPRVAHAGCLALWQLQRAGRSEETICRFCRCELPHWKHGLGGCDPVVCLDHEGKSVRLRVPIDTPAVAFEEIVRWTLGIPRESEVSMDFDCTHPASGTPVRLIGAASIPTALHYAAVVAARRKNTIASNV